MKINIACSDTGWIYDKFIQEFQKHSKHDILRNAPVKCDVTHYVPYYEVPKAKHIPGPSTAWFSHQEGKDPVKAKFLSAAKTVDVAISHSKKYADFLRDKGIGSAIQVIPGVDLDKFKLRDVSKPRDKLVVGYVGRQYTSSNRKNPTLLNKIAALPFTFFKTTGGKLKPDEIPEFYASLDVVISPAIIEGGPMAVQEALACGVPVVCFENVGVAQEFNLGVLKAKDSDDFIGILERLHTTKEHFVWWNNPDTMERMRKQVEKQTWKRFAQEHDKIWEGLVNETRHNR